MGNNSTTVSFESHDKRHKAQESLSNADCRKKKNNSSGMVPEVSCNELEAFESTSKKSNAIHSNGNSAHFSKDGLVVPKKIPNPCLESSEKQDLHKELLFNQKIGRSVIGQKTELQKAMDKFKDDQKKKEIEEEKVQKKTAFEKKLEEQANKLKLQEESELKKSEAGSADQPEFLRVRARVCAQGIDPET